MKSGTSLLPLLCFSTTFACAANDRLELPQIFGPGAIAAERAPSIRWIGDAYSTLEKSGTVDGSDLVRYDAASGKRSVIARAETMSDGGKPLSIDGYDWSRDGRRVLLTVESPEARRNNPVSHVWLLDVRAQSLRKVGAGLPAPLLHAEFSPDGTRIAYVCANNLYVESLDGKRAQLTTDGDDIVLNGRGDLAYEEEFSLGKAYHWSPDSRRIAYWRFDTRGVGTFYMIRNTDGQYSTPVPLQYPKPGTTNAAARVGVVSIDGGATRWFELDGDPRENYVPRMDWAGNDEVLIQSENRRQNTC
jgi:dipeptidyl-peptidase-4